MIDLGRHWTPSGHHLRGEGQDRVIRWGIVITPGGVDCTVHKDCGVVTGHSPLGIIVLRATAELFARLTLMSLHILEQHINGHYIYFGMPRNGDETEAWMWFALTLEPDDLMSWEKGRQVARSVAALVLQLTEYKEELAPEQSWRTPRIREEED